MNVKFEQKKDKILLNVTLPFRGKRGENKFFSTADALNWLKQNHPEVKVGKLISSPVKAINNIKRLQGEWVFELEKEKPLDIPVNYVKIDIPIVEAEFPPLVDEEKPKAKKASLSSNDLPNGFKKTTPKTKAKKKRTTKKKTEE
jgi:hypothetical protein